MSSEKAFTIRSYRASDRAGVRRLCCQTGFLGEPIDPVYEDRQLFADFLTTYYTDHEPESSFVLEADGEIRGYLLGSRRPLQNQLYALYQNVWLFFRALARYFRYNERSRRFIRWTLVHGWREVPAAPRRVPHFHINLLPDARKVSTTRALMSAEECRRWQRPWDLRILEAVEGAPFNLLHVCGAGIHLDEFADYPVTALSFATGPGNPRWPSNWRAWIS